MNSDSRFVQVLKTVLLGLVIFYAGYWFSLSIQSGQTKTFIILGAATAFFLLLLKRIDILFIFGYLVVNRLFINYFFHVPGFLKSFDLGLIMCMMAGIIMWYKSLVRRVDIFKGPFAVSSLIYLAYLMFCVLQTSVIYGQSLLQTVQMARFWMYFIIYFGALPFFIVVPESKWMRLFRIIAVITVIASFLYLVQRTFQFPFLRFLYPTGSHNRLAGAKVIRMHARFAGPSVLVIGMLFAYLIHDKVVRYKKLCWAGFGILFLQPIFSIARGFTVATMTLVGTILLLAQVPVQRKIKAVAIGGILSFAAIMVSGFLLYGNFVKWGNILFLRFVSAGQDFVNKSGTYGIRSEGVENQRQLIRYNKPIGIGFIHPASGLFVEETGGYIGTGHHGYTTIIAQTGYIGMVFFILFTVVIFVMGFRVSRMRIPFFYRAIGLTFCGVMVWGYPNMLSSTAFILERSFMNMGLAMALMQIGSLIEKKILTSELDMDA